MKNKIFFGMFITIWVVLILLNFMVPNIEFSEKENRYLAKYPSLNWEELVDGKYVPKVDTYINDHFVFRNTWIQIKSMYEKVLGKTQNNGVYIGKDGYLFEKFEYTQKEKDKFQKIAQTINLLSQNKEIPVTFLLIPNSNSINKDKLPNNVVEYEQEKIVQEFYEKLDKDVNKIEVIDILEENKQRQLYFRTDHHMTTQGAYLVYKQYCNQMQIQEVSEEEFKKEVVSNEFLGTLDSKAQQVNQIPDTIEVYTNQYTQIEQADYDGIITNSLFNEEYLKGKDKYSYFLNGNNANVKIKTKIKNGKKLLIIKDSYAHIMAPFLCQHYEEVFFVDPRYYRASISEYIEKNEITEVLFLYNVSNLLEDNSLQHIK